MRLGYNSLSVLRSYTFANSVGNDTAGSDGGPFEGTLQNFKGKDRDSNTNLIQADHNTENKFKNDT